LRGRVARRTLASVRMRVLSGLLAAAVVAVGAPREASAQRLETGSAARVLGASAVELLGAHASVLSAIVEVPPGVDPVAYGLRPIVGGIAVLHGDAAALAGFARVHASWPMEIAPPLRRKLDLAVPYVGASPVRLGGALDGRGVYVGVVDTGVDPLHPDFLDASGHTRIAWMLDLSQKPRDGNALDQKYGGRVYDRASVDAMVTAGHRADDVPDDWDGHGTHVAGIAVGGGGPSPRYVGVAPAADLIVVCASRSRAGEIQEADAILGTAFVFDMAKNDARPAVVNLSLGSQFGPHDGSSTFERGLAALAKGPGRAVVVAASNEGAWPWIHASVRVTPNARFDVPIHMPGKDGKGTGYDDAYLYLYVKNRDGGRLSLGLRGPNGDSWMDPVDAGGSYETHPTADLKVVVANEAANAPSIPAGSHGAFAVVWGKIPAGDVKLTLEGDASVEAWIEGASQSLPASASPTFLYGGQVEGTVGIPASSDALIAAGCVALRQQYRDIRGGLESTVDAPEGTRCFFSSSGPNMGGAMRPDILAPGLFVISTLAGRAYQAAPLGEFDDTMIVDRNHAALSGTSMSSPFVAGAAALLLQREPTLDQEGIRAALQAGARRLVDDDGDRLTTRDYAKGAGMLDVAGALAALDRRASPPAATSLQLRFGSSFLPNDRTPVTAIALARDAAGLAADVPGGLVVTLLGAELAAPVEHPMPGLYRFLVTAPKDAGGTTATVRLDGVPGATITQTLPIAADRWDAHYGLTVGGGCALTRDPRGALQPAVGALGALALTALRRRSRSRSRAEG
jgi:subtilisin family serine protease